jgi:hypothetical protein
MRTVVIAVIALGALFGVLVALSPNQHDPTPPLQPITPVQYGER